MSVVVTCSSNNTVTEADKVGTFAPDSMPELIINTYHDHNEEVDGSQQPGQTDIWNLIQSQKPDVTRIDVPPPYVHPLVRRSSSSLSQKSLEICTESLGSETGSDDFLFSSSDTESTESEHGNRGEFDESDERLVGKSTPAVKIGPVYVTNQELPYHCTSAPVNNRKSPPRSFPPPLPSISNRNGGPCLRMRPHRCGNGRLVMEAVSMSTQNYLHARRLDGRLLLSFGDQHAADQTEQEKPETESETEFEESETEEVEMEESEEEEEVEVVDRGTMVEVKVSTQVQPNQPASKKVHRSSLVINKFVGSSPDDAMTAAANTVPAILPRSRRVVAMPTTAAAAMVAASALSASSRYEGPHDMQEEEDQDGQLLFIATTAGSRRRSKEELLHQMRRCSQLRRPLFIWEKEPRCIATL